ncbi:MAG: NAD-dependent deacetylase [Caulobacteraceae bacterium]|nr:NAD-dependent deacetylase [Caulobacteraceae bacterium]
MPPAAARLAALLSPARRVVVFTGAGVSTESGIPDFRSPGGVWSRMKPITYQQFMASEDMRREAWTRAFSGIARWTGSQPNAGHRAVTRLIAAGKVSSVITQNVDNLHQDAGAPADKVIELHGNASYATCLACRLRHELEALRPPFQERGEIPACRACGGVVKTAVVSFGQQMPPGVMERARDETLAADLFLVLGSSLTVYPAAGLPALAGEAGIPLAMVNRDPTPQDHLAHLVLREEIGPLMSEVVEALVVGLG